MALTLQAYQAGDMQLLPDTLEECVQSSEKTILENRAYTVWDEDAPIACGGIIHCWRGIGQAWVMITHHAHEYHRKEIVRLIALTGDAIIADQHLHRLQALVRPDFQMGQHFVEHLGFEYEGYLRAYTSEGYDLMMYAKIFEGHL